MSQPSRRRDIGKLALVLASLLPLASCINVDDFGAYWEKAGKEKRLVGKWKVISASPEQTRGHAYAVGSIMTIVDKGDAYEMSFLDAEGTDTDPIYPVKSLIVGKYRFLAMQPHQGAIFRYKLSEHELVLCQSRGPNLLEFVNRNYPNAVNIKENKDGDFVDIKLFDDEVFGIVSKIPDTETYWSCAQKYQSTR